MTQSRTETGLIVDLHHVSLLVANTVAAVAFYRDVLGLSLDRSRPDLGYSGAWLWAGDRQIHLLELPDPDSGADPRPGPGSGRPEHGGRDRHLALMVTDLARVAQRLDTAGVAYTRSRSGRATLFCRDSDQNPLELIQEDAAAPPSSA